LDTDINYIILKSINGDKISQEILLKKLHPLIYKNIYKYYEPVDSDIEDLVQEGYIVILKSLETYNKALNIHFLGYVKSNLSFYYKNYYRNTKNQRKTVSLNQTLGDTRSSFELVNLIEDKTIDLVGNLTREEEIKELHANIQKLSIKEQNVLNMYYIDKLSMSEISKQLNIAYSTATGRKYMAMQKLKKMMRA